jgi:hypothetical protein
VRRTLKIRPEQKIPAGAWDELVVAINAETDSAHLPDVPMDVRLALPVYTAESDFPRLRVAVKNFIRRGFVRWEAADLATLRLLRSLAVEDLSADWSLYAFNSAALAELSARGVRRFVASAENGCDNLRALAQSGYDVEFLEQQSTPLFISLTPPAVADLSAPLTAFRRDGLWVTTRNVPRTFDPPRGVSTRLDLSWGCL